MRQTVVKGLMGLLASDWQFILMTVFGLLAAHLVAAGVLNWSVAARRPRSPVRDGVQRRLLQRVARAEVEMRGQTPARL